MASHLLEKFTSEQSLPERFVELVCVRSGLTAAPEPWAGSGQRTLSQTPFSPICLPPATRGCTLPADLTPVDHREAVVLRLPRLERREHAGGAGRRYIDGN